MKGDMKVIEVSSERFLLKKNKTYKNVVLIARDYHYHNLTLSNKKSFVFFIQAVSVENEVLFFEGDGYLEEEQGLVVPPVMLELKFFPKQIEKPTKPKPPRKRTNRRKD